MRKPGVVAVLVAQLAVVPLLADTAATPPAPGWDHAALEGRVFAQIFVRSYRDSNGDGIGDFAGLTAALDHLNDGNPATTSDLGVEGIWLMPMFESPSYHGYDVVDYLSVERDYGTLADLRAFLDAAHARGIEVIVDLVMNHSSAQHPWFQAAAASPDSPWRSYYVWRDDNPGWTQPWGSGPTWHHNPGDDNFYYGIFWGGMPDLNFAEPRVRDEMKRIAAHWLALGVDGFRLDATRHLYAEGGGEMQNDRPATHEFLRELSASVRRLDPTAILVGENWTTTERIAPYFGATSTVSGGDELPLNFNFPLGDAIVAGVRDGDEGGIELVLEDMAELYPPGVLDAPFLRNHDQLRLATELAAEPVQLRLAAAILLTLPGVPFVYYGEEVGLVNGGTDRDDRLKRTPMPWRDDEPGGGFTSGTPWFPFAPGRAAANVATQSADPNSLLSHYRNWIRLRRANPALSHGDLTLLDAPPGVLAYLRREGIAVAAVFHNLGSETRTIEVPAALGAEVRVANGSVLPADRLPENAGLQLAAGQSVVLTNN